MQSSSAGGDLNNETLKFKRQNDASPSLGVPKVTVDAERAPGQGSGPGGSPGRNSKNLASVRAQAQKEGKLIPAVDFMDMNKTMIDFSKQQRNSLADSKLNESIEEVSSPGKETFGQPMPGPPKLKQSGAFRHTEYAKGFYKVGNTAGGATTTANIATTNDSVSRRSSIAMDNA